MAAVCKFRNLVTGVPHLVLPGAHMAGRSEHADILLADESISRVHARIYNTDQGIMVEDLGSSNGTYVQGRRITGKVRVGLGEEVRLGAVTFRIDPEVGEAGGIGERLASEQKLEPEQMRRRTNKITAEELDAARVKKATARQVPSVPPAVMQSGGRYPGSSLFQTTATATSVAPVAPLISPPPAQSSLVPWVICGFSVGVAVGMAVGWWMARL